MHDTKDLCERMAGTIGLRPKKAERKGIPDLPSLIFVTRQAATLENISRLSSAHESVFEAVFVGVSSLEARRRVRLCHHQLLALTSSTCWLVVLPGLPSVRPDRKAKIQRIREEIHVSQQCDCCLKDQSRRVLDPNQTMANGMVARVKLAVVNHTLAHIDNKHQHPITWNFQLAKCATIILVLPSDNPTCASPVHYEHRQGVLVNTDMNTPLLAWTLSSILAALCIDKDVLPLVHNMRVSDSPHESVHIGPRRRATQSQTRPTDCRHPKSNMSSHKHRNSIKRIMHERTKVSAQNSSAQAQFATMEHKRHRSETSVQILMDGYWRNVDSICNARQILHEHLNSDLETCKSLLTTSSTWDPVEISDFADLVPQRLFHSRPRSIRSRRSRVPYIDVAEDLQSAKEHINDLRRKKYRLEDIVRNAKEREEKLKSQLHKLAESKSRTERRLNETIEGKQSLENEINSLLSVNKRLAQYMGEHHSRLSLVEADQDDLAHRIELLQQEREQLHSQLANVQRDNTSLRMLDAGRRRELEVKMRQTAAVENRLLAALDRFHALVAEHTATTSKSAELDKAHGEAQNRLEFAQRMLRAVEESAEGQRVRIEFLEEKEQTLWTDISMLTDQNIQLQQDLDRATTELMTTREAYSGMSTRIEDSESALAQSRLNAERAGQRIDQLSGELSQVHSSQLEAAKQVQLLGDELLRKSDDHDELMVRLNDSNTNLDFARSEAQRLESIVESHSRDMKLAEESLETLSDKFVAFMEESEQRLQQNETERRRLASARDLARSKLQIFEDNTKDLCEINKSLQHIVHELELGQSVDDNTILDIGSALRLPEDGVIGRTVEEMPVIEDLFLLQSNMTKLHTILTQIRMRQKVDRTAEQAKYLSASTSQLTSPPSSTRSSSHYSLFPAIKVKGSSSITSDHDLHSIRESSIEATLQMTSTSRKISALPEDRKSWSSLESTWLPCDSTPPNSLRCVNLVTPSTDPFVSQASTAAHCQDEPQTAHNVADASQRLQQLFEDKKPPSYGRSLHVNVKPKSDVSPLRSPCFTDKDSGFEAVRIDSMQLPPRVDSMSTASAMHTPINTSYDRSYADQYSDPSSYMTYEEHKQFEAFEFTTSPSQDVEASPTTSRFDGISKAKVRRLAVDVEAYHSTQSLQVGSTNGGIRRDSHTSLLSNRSTKKIADPVSALLSSPTKLARTLSRKSIANIRKSRRNHDVPKSTVSESNTAASSTTARDKSLISDDSNSHSNSSNSNNSNNNRRHKSRPDDTTTTAVTALAGNRKSRFAKLLGI